MARWQNLVSLVGLITLTGVAQGQTYSLAEPAQPGTFYRIQLSMALTGQMKVFVDNQEKSLKETATASHEYIERIFEASQDGTAAKSARVYKEAKVAITVDGRQNDRGLRANRKFVAAQRLAEGVLVWSPEGPLTREEADVTDHFDASSITGLLPATNVAVADSWKVSNATAQALCHLQALSEQSLTCKLEQVKDDVAIINISGSASGIDLGASVKTTVAGSAHFDLKEHRLVALDWRQSDERGQGPVSPAAEVEVAVKVTRAVIEPVNELSEIAVVPLQTRQALTDLETNDSKDRFALQYARDWYLVGRTDEHLVFRLMDHGEYVAQLTIAPWQKAAAGNHLSPDEVKSIVANSPGWGQDTLLKAEEIKLTTGQWAYLVAGEGDLGNDRAVQYFYFIAGPHGDQAMLTFTMTPGQTQKLGSRDLEVVRGFLLPGARREQDQIKAAPGE
jgi:hypothetical protein